MKNYFYKIAIYSLWCTQLFAGNTYSPTVVYNLQDGSTNSNGNTFSVLTRNRMIETATIGSNTYAIVATSSEDGIQIIDVTNPSSPLAIVDVQDGDTDSNGNTFSELDSPFGLEIVTISGSTYAIIAANGDDGIQIIDISTPSTPLSVTSIANGSTDTNGNTFAVLDGPMDVETVTIDNNIYAIISSYTSDGIQIIDITDPSTPLAIASATDGGTDADNNTFTELNGAVNCSIITINGSVYTFIAAEVDDGVQIIDISTPSTPKAIYGISHNGADTNGEIFYRLDGARSVNSFSKDGSDYIVVTSINKHGIQIIDVSNPSIPLVVSQVGDGQADINGNSFEKLRGSYVADLMTFDGNTYVYVPSYTENAVQIIDVTIPSTPLATASFFDGGTDENGATFTELAGAFCTKAFTVGSGHYLMVGTRNDAGVQIVNLHSPFTAISKYGKITTVSSSQVNKNGTVGHRNALDANGQVID